MRYTALAILLGLFLAGHAFAGETLSTIKNAGMLRCGVSTGVPGFSERDKDGRWDGLDADFCRAVAAAILGDPEKVKFTPLPALARFPALMSGEIDLLARNTTWTVGREAAMNLVFTGPLLYSLQGVMVRTASGIRQLPELAGKTLCVVAGTTQDAALDSWAQKRDIRVEKRSFDNDVAARTAYFAGECQGYASDDFLLEAARLQAPDGREAHAVLVEKGAMDPLSPAVRRDDAQFTQVVKAVWACLLLAEEAGLTRASLAASNTAVPAVTRFQAQSDALAKALGIPPGWALRAVAAVGNYGELFERHLGTGSQLGLERGPNRLWSAGGLMLPPGF